MLGLTPLTSELTRGKPMSNFKRRLLFAIHLLIGLPALPVAGIFWLLDRYILFRDLPPKYRMFPDKEALVAFAAALTIVFGGVYINLLLWQSR
jgi:hypothetical protein